MVSAFATDRYPLSPTVPYLEPPVAASPANCGSNGQSFTSLLVISIPTTTFVRHPTRMWDLIHWCPDRSTPYFSSNHRTNRTSEPRAIDCELLFHRVIAGPTGPTNRAIRSTPLGEEAVDLVRVDGPEQVPGVGSVVQVTREARLETVESLKMHANRRSAMRTGRGPSRRTSIPGHRHTVPRATLEGVLFGVLRAGCTRSSSGGTWAASERCR